MTKPYSISLKKRRMLLKAAFSGTCIASFSSYADKIGASRADTNIDPYHVSTDSTPYLAGNSVQSVASYQCIVANRQGQPLIKWSLPDRGHGVAMMPLSHHTHHLVSFARRPGKFLCVFDYQTGERITEIHTQSIQYDRGESYFYGHGVYTPDHKYLLATQGIQATSEGFIGVYEVEKGYQKVDEWHGIGIGPHEIIALEQGGYAVGIGGVHTLNRKPLNIESMKPALLHLDHTGQKVARSVLTDKQLSIRHLAQSKSRPNFIACGQQYRGEIDDYPSLIALWDFEQDTLIELNAEPEQWARFNHYIASIAMIDDYLLATSPRGNCYGIWSISQNKLLSLNPLMDASGVLVDDTQFFVSSGEGQLVRCRGSREIKRQQEKVQWDNHWFAIPTA